MSTTTAEKPAQCPYCGSLAKHPGMCPTIKSVEYHEDGRIKRIEFRDTGVLPPSIFDAVFGRR